MSGRALSETALDPLDYPWTDRVVLDESGRRSGRAVLAVGCNAAPAVLRAKLARHGVDADVAVVPRRVTGLAVGHSAHVSVRGYIPAAPYAAPGAHADLHVSWFDAAQLAALDETEPNYVRVPYGGADVYVSRWGVVALGGVPVPLMGQRELHRLLDAVGAGSDAVVGADPDSTLARLQDADVRERLRTTWADGGFVVSSGLAEA